METTIFNKDFIRIISSSNNPSNIYSSYIRFHCLMVEYWSAIFFLYVNPHSFQKGVIRMVACHRKHIIAFNCFDTLSRMIDYLVFCDFINIGPKFHCDCPISN